MFRKIKIFISSVQREFAHERRMLLEYIRSDALLGKFFLFEETTAASITPETVYLDVVNACEIYLGLIGNE